MGNFGCVVSEEIYLVSMVNIVVFLQRVFHDVAAAVVVAAAAAHVAVLHRHAGLLLLLLLLLLLHGQVVLVGGPGHRTKSLSWKINNKKRIESISDP